MTTRVRINLNLIDPVTGSAFTGLEEVQGDVAAGDTVEVYEPTCGFAGQAYVTEVDHKYELIYLAVDWSRFQVVR